MLSSRWSSDAGNHPTTSDVVVGDDAHGLYLVARGLGPEPRRTHAVKSAAAAAQSLVLRSIALDPRAPLDVLARLAIEDANGAVWRQRDPAHDGVQVVLTLLLVRNGQVAVGHVGHGQVLRVVGGVTVPLTMEHTVAAEHGRLGYPPPEDIIDRPDRLTRSLGERMFVDVDVHGHALTSGTTYFLLSSGFGGARLSDEVGRLASDLELSRLPAKLIEIARSVGQQERLSVLVVHPPRREFKTEDRSAVRSSLHRVWSSMRRGITRRRVIGSM